MAANDETERSDVRQAQAGGVMNKAAAPPLRGISINAMLRSSPMGGDYSDGARDPGWPPKSGGGDEYCPRTSRICRVDAAADPYFSG
jgi:hypothetical protein